MNSHTQQKNKKGLKEISLNNNMNSYTPSKKSSENIFVKKHNLELDSKSSSEEFYVEQDKQKRKSISKQESESDNESDREQKSEPGSEQASESGSESGSEQGSESDSESGSEEESKSEITIIDFPDFDTHSLTFGLMRKSTHQYKTNIKYGKNDCVMMLSPQFVITSGGIMPEHENIKNRNNIMIPLEKENTEFKKLLQKIDKSLIKNASKVFGDDVDIKTKTQIPLVKKPDKKYRYRPKFFKLNFDVEYGSQKILTKIFVKGKQVKTKTIDDIAKHVTWGSTIQMVILIEKIWADNIIFENSSEEPTFGKIKPKDKDARFGITLKALQINVVKKREKSPRESTLDSIRKSNKFGTT